MVKGRGKWSRETQEKRVGMWVSVREGDGERKGKGVDMGEGEDGEMRLKGRLGVWVVVWVVEWVYTHHSISMCSDYLCESVC